MNKKEDLSTMPLVDLFINISKMEQDIGIKELYLEKYQNELNEEIKMYKSYKNEVIKRFPGYFEDAFNDFSKKKVK